MNQLLYAQIKSFMPYNEQERVDRQLILACLEKYPDILYRSNDLAHMTVSAWVVNGTRDHVLMVYHNIYHSWSWLGGHADGDANLLHVAMKEVMEESGLAHVSPVMTDIYSLEALTVDGHEKHGEYVHAHIHLNVTYLLTADEKEGLQMKPDENSDVAWFSLEEAVKASTEPWFQTRIYPKLNAKLKQL